MRLRNTNIAQLASVLKLQAAMMLEEGQAAVAGSVMQHAMALEKSALNLEPAVAPVLQRR